MPYDPSQPDAKAQGAEVEKVRQQIEKLKQQAPNLKSELDQLMQSVTTLIQSGGQQQGQSKTPTT
jgi:dsDNA-specific endonuclease/ATPase MutS2